MNTPAQPTSQRRALHGLPRAAAAALSLLCLLVAWPAAAAPQDADDPKWCRACHQEPELSAKSFRQSAHAKQTCRDCHTGFQFNPHEPVQVAKGKDIDALKELGFAQPVALASCISCHDDATAAAGTFDHAKPREGAKPLTAKEAKDKGMPYCMDCHGPVHEIALSKDQTAVERRRAMNERCVKCHGDAKKMEPFQRSAKMVKEYEHTMHARKLELGSEDAPGCMDCHPAHQKARAKAQKEGSACAQCHKGVDKDFAVLANHKPVDRETRPVSFWTQKFFAWLTFLTILALSLHVLLDLLGAIRRSWFKHEDPHHAAKLEQVPLPALAAVSGGRVEPAGTVLRFDVWQRIAHGVMALSFTTLVLTGWPLSAAGIGASQSLVRAFGGLEQVAWLHRVAALGLVLACVLHLAYLLALVAKGKLRFSMLPKPKDIKDLVANLAWFVGLRKQRPAYDRFSYFEKFDYWAVFWGCVIMIGSGAVRWFPDTVLKMAPTWVYEVAFLAHTDEALLAALAIFVWHFYNVHLRPAVFPMSWVFLTGRMTLEEHAEEHGAEFDAWQAAAKARGQAPAAVPAPVAAAAPVAAPQPVSAPAPADTVAAAPPPAAEPAAAAQPSAEAQAEPQKPAGQDGEGR